MRTRDQQKRLLIKIAEIAEAINTDIQNINTRLDSLSLGDKDKFEQIKRDMEAVEIVSQQLLKLDRARLHLDECKVGIATAQQYYRGES
jgi:methyl-accepting chemotaxis protein